MERIEELSFRPVRRVLASLVRDLMGSGVFRLLATVLLGTSGATGAGVDLGIISDLLRALGVDISVFLGGAGMIGNGIARRLGAIRDQVEAKFKSDLEANKLIKEIHSVLVVKPENVSE